MLGLGLGLVIGLGLGVSVSFRAVRDSVSVRVRVRIRVRVRVVARVRVRVRVGVQSRWNHTPDTMDSTRQYGHWRHHGIIHQTLCMLPGNMDIIGPADSKKPYRIHYGHLQTQHTPGNNTQDVVHTTNNNGHNALCRDRASKEQTHRIPQGSKDNADTREPYNRQYAQ